MKRLACLIAVITALLACGMGSGTVQAASGQGKVLVVFHLDGTETAEKTAEEVVRQVLYAGFDCDAVEQSAYTAGETGGYDRVILIGDGTALPAALSGDLSSYTGRLCWIGPGLRQCPRLSALRIQYAGGLSGIRQIRYLSNGNWRDITLGAAVSAENYTVGAGVEVLGYTLPDGSAQGVLAFSTGALSYFGLTAGLETDDRLRAALESLLAAFFGRQANGPGLYLDLDYIYPVSDFNRIADMGAYLKEKELAFTFTVMPFYVNAQTPEAGNYGKLLRYLVACGGTPVIHIPVFQPASAGEVPTYAVMSARLETALQNYAALGVYPTALEMQENNLLRSGFTGFFAATGDYFAVNGDGKDVYTTGAETVDAQLETGLSHFSAAPSVVRELRAPSNFQKYDAFYEELSFCSGDPYGGYRISFPSDMDFSAFKELVDGLDTHGVQINNFLNGTHFLKVGKTGIERTDGAVTYNGAVVNQQPSSVSGTSSAQSRPASSQATGWLQGGNTVVIAISLVSMFVFIIAIFVGIQADKDKFLRRR